MQLGTRQPRQVRGSAQCLNAMSLVLCHDRVQFSNYPQVSSVESDARCTSIVRRPAVREELLWLRLRSR
jgi:hypothetical protein